MARQLLAALLLQWVPWGLRLCSLNCNTHPT